MLLVVLIHHYANIKAEKRKEKPYMQRKSRVDVDIWQNAASLNIQICLQSNCE